MIGHYQHFIAHLHVNHYNLTIMTHILRYIAAAFLMAAAYWPCYGAVGDTFDATASDGNVYTFAVLTENPNTVSVKGKTKNNNTMSVPATIANDGTDYTVTTVVTKAFYNFTPTIITLPNTITTLEYRAFYFCKTDVINLNEGLTSIPNNCFEECRFITSLTLPESVTTLGQYIIKNCNSLSNINIGSNVTTLGDYCLASANGLRTFTVPSTVSNLRNRVFESCKNLKEVTYTNPSMTWTANTLQGPLVGSNVEKLTLPATMTSLPNAAFCQSKTLKEIVLPTGLTAIPDNCFEHCEALTTVTLPTTVTTIGTSAFKSCFALESLTLPASVQIIKGSAFQDCTSLTQIDIPEGVETLNGLTFSGCSSLQRVGLPTTLNTLKSMVFLDCAMLESIDIPEGVTEIPLQAFKGCTSLEHVELPSTVSTVNEKAFMDCTHLRYLSLPMINSGAGYADVVKGCEMLDTIEIYAHTEVTGTNAPTNFVQPFIPMVEDGHQLSCLIIHGRANTAQDVTQMTVNFEGVNRDPAEYMFIDHIVCLDDGNPQVPMHFSTPLSNFYPTELTIKCPVTDPATLYDGCDMLQVLELGGNGAAEHADVAAASYAGMTELRELHLLPGLNTSPLITGQWGQAFETIRVHYTEPPVITDDTFSAETYANGTLIVPMDFDKPVNHPDNLAIIEAYKNAPGWRNFFTADRNGITVGIDDIVSSTAQEGAPEYYDLQGRRVVHPVHGLYICRGRKVLL